MTATLKIVRPDWTDCWIGLIADVQLIAQNVFFCMALVRKDVAVVLCKDYAESVHL